MSQSDFSQPGSMFDLADRYRAPSGALSRLIYVSRRSASLDEDQLIDTLLTASVRNFLSGISGELWLSQTHFLQTLEGTASSVDTCYRRIQLDVRHTDITCVQKQRVETRAFIKPLAWQRVAGDAWPAALAKPVDLSGGFDEICAALIQAGQGKTSR